MSQPRRTLRMSDAPTARRYVLRDLGKSSRTRADRQPAADALPSAKAAASMQPDDPRWVLAVRTRELMQGALLAPEHRSNLLRLGRILGLTPFEANLVIAIVQDQARRGEVLEAAVDNLSMVPRYRRTRAARRWPSALAWGVALVAAEVLLLVALLG